MKIVFITASLETGKDGVGDYTQRLAGALRERGWHVVCISLADRFVSKKSESDYSVRPMKGNDSDVLRLSAEIPWQKRFEILQRVINTFQPDWLSLQYVPYGWHQRGLPFSLPQRLASLEGNFRWHIMFHELWIGEETGYSLFQKVIGWFQKRIVRELASTTRALLHTSNLQYVTRLRNESCPAKLLPLFSNIPITPPLFLRDKVLLEAGVEPDQQDDSHRWIFVLFGAIHPEWSPEPLILRIDALRRLEGRPPCLVVVLGRCSMRMVQRVSNACLQSNWGFLYKGELPSPLISSYLQCADFGLATSPYSLIGKSGSVAAMQEHGLPVVVSRLEGMDRETGIENLIRADTLFEKNLLQAQKHTVSSRLDETVDQLIGSLTP